MPVDLGQIISGQGLAAKPGPLPAGQNAVANNVHFLRRPDVRAGLLQLGVSLLTPGSSAGSAIGDAFGAAGRFHSQRRDRDIQDEQRQQVAARSEADIGRIEAETGAASARAEANRASAGYTGAQTDALSDQVSRRDAEGERKDVQISQQGRALSIEEDKLRLMRDQYRAQLLAPGTADELDDNMFEAAVKLYSAQVEARGIVGDSTDFSFDPQEFNSTLNNLRQSMGRSALLIPGQQGQGGQSTGPKQVITAAHIKQLYGEGATVDQLLSLSSQFTLTPEALQEITSILQGAKTQSQTKQ